MCLLYTGSEAARLLISTDAAVMVSDLDGLNMMDISEREEITQSTKESNGERFMQGTAVTASNH